MILLTRCATFSASHYYWIDSWSAEDNARVFGKCANKNGHGHNYKLEVTVSGTPDPITGFVADLKALKDVIETQIIEVYDHRHLNLEVPEFAKAIPTTENISIAIWNRMNVAINKDPRLQSAKLHAIRVYETPEIFAEYRGEKA